MAGFGAATTLEALGDGRTAGRSTPTGRSRAGSTGATCWRWPAGPRWPTRRRVPAPAGRQRPLPRGARGRPGRAGGARAAVRPPDGTDPGVTGHRGRSVRGGPGHLRAARQCGAVLRRRARPQLPPEADCPRLPVDGPGFTVPLMAVVAERLDPATMAWAVGRPSGRGELRGYVRLDDGQEPDPVALLAVVDALPPATFDLGVTGWVPTLGLTCHVRATPAPGPLVVRQRPGWSVAAGSTRSATSGTRPAGWWRPGTSSPAYDTHERRQRRDLADLRAGGTALPRTVRRTAMDDSLIDLVTAHAPEGAHVLEIGSGPGFDAAVLEERGFRVRRTDATAAFVEMLRARLHHHPQGRRRRGVEQPQGRAAAALRLLARGAATRRAVRAGWVPVVVDHLATPGPWLVSLSRRPTGKRCRKQLRQSTRVRLRRPGAPARRGPVGGRGAPARPRRPARPGRRRPARPRRRPARCSRGRRR